MLPQVRLAKFTGVAAAVRVHVPCNAHMHIRIPISLMHNSTYTRAALTSYTAARGG